ncbi:MAG: prolyl oligopeptidase family serine peptidase [Actinobacteria bacterium]|nr:prolyl oligopeptidase family serine peptidase [Actinomycetota bacterium]
MAALCLAGCPVKEKPGTGVRFTITDPQTSRRGYLYIPAGYDVNKSWPVVLTFHAYKPFGGAERQIREWSSTADKYGLIIVAPVLVNSGPQMPYRLYRISPSVEKDVQAAMGMLDYVLTHTAADPDRVYITGFSYGGFLMHYVANRFPDRFAALCSRNCSFNPGILNEDNARRMAERNFPVMIYYTEHDMWYIKDFSKTAVDWYRDRGFSVQTEVIPQSMMPPGWGHFEAYPEIAAEFFLSSTGLNSKLRIIASPQTGPAPLPVNLSVQLPHQLDSDDLTYLWTFDGQPLAHTPQAYTSISEQGVYDIQVMVTDGQGRTLTAKRKITVGPPGI